MRKLVPIAAAAIVLASVTAYAQMHHGQNPAGHGPMHDQKQGMQQKMKEMMQKHGQGGHGGHGGHQAAAGGHDAHTAAGPKGDRGPSSMAFHAINQKMHEGMNIAFTGNADVDFVNGMIPHHEGAVQMAKVVLAFGSDPEIRKLAEEVVRAQDAEIALMRAWLKRKTQQ